MCHQGNVHWSDSCANPLDLIEECLGQTTCFDTAPGCCLAYQEAGVVGPGPTGAFWGATDHEGATRTFIVDISAVEGAAAQRLSAVGEHDDQPGLDLVRTEPGSFSAIVETGAAVGIDYDWQPGQYEFRVTRAEQDGTTDWFNAHLTLPGQAETLIGGIAFERTDVSMPASINNTATVNHRFLESVNYSTAPTTTATVGIAEGLGFIAGRVVYDNFVNSDVFFDMVQGTVTLSAGSKVVRCHPDGNF
jgi:hypothetical protein